MGVHDHIPPSYLTSDYFPIQPQLPLERIFNKTLSVLYLRIYSKLHIDEGGKKNKFCFYTMRGWGLWQVKLGGSFNKGGKNQAKETETNSQYSIFGS